jgi:hypothetical protein
MALISQGNVGVRRTELPFLVEANVSPESLELAVGTAESARTPQK